jgi:uncharacterized protein (TIRG00374 family)
MTAVVPSGDRKPGKPAASLRRILLGAIRFGIGIVLLVYLAKSGFIRLHDLDRLLAAWPLTLLALALISLHIALISWRLSLLFRPQGLRLPYVSAVKLNLVELFFDNFLPGAAGGTVAKLFYATRENQGRRTEVATVILLDRAVGISSLILLPLLFAPFFIRFVLDVHVLKIILIAYVIIFLCLIGTFFAALRSRAQAERIAGVFHFRVVREFARRALLAISAYRGSRATLFFALGLSLLANLAIIAVLTVGVLAVDPASLAWRLCLIVPIGQVINSLPTTPGGLGVGEVAFHSLFHLSGLRGGAAAMLSWRIWGVIISGFGLLIYLRGLGRSVHDQSGGANRYPQSGESRPSVPADG